MKGVLGRDVRSAVEMCLPEATVAHANKEEKRVGRKKSPVFRRAHVLSQGLEG